MLRREPYRLLFPLGLLLAVAGVVPWLLFTRGVIHTWPGLPHALVMSQGFFLAIALGFLATMLPRRTGTAPLGVPVLAGLALGVIAAAGAFLAGAIIAGELAYLATFAGLAVVAGRRARSAGALPPSFVLVPTGAALAVVGAALLVAGAGGGPEWTVRVGRGLVSQGFMLALVLGVAPMLTPILLGAAPPKPRPAGLFVAVALVLGASFAIEELAGPRAGLLVRALVCVAALAGAGALRHGTKPGVHRAAYRVALLLVPAGLLAAALVPERRIALLHITFGGGFALLILAVTVHVTLFHGGRATLADRWPVAAVAAVVLALAAVAVRACLETFGPRYIDAMAFAAALWIAAVAIWAGFLAPHLTRST